MSMNRIHSRAKLSKTAKLESPVRLDWDVDVGPDCHIGRYTYISSYTVIGRGVELGRYCSIASFAQIGVIPHPTSFMSTHPFQYSDFHFRGSPEYIGFERVAYDRGAPVIVGNDVWIGTKAIISRGVKIENGAIIGAGSFVNKDVPAYAIVAGSPARILRYRFTDEIIDRLQTLEWWNLPMSKLSGVAFDQIETAVKQLEGIVREMG